MNPLSAPATPLPSIPAPSPRTAAPPSWTRRWPRARRCPSPVSAASAARAAPRSWKAATNASHRPTNAYVTADDELLMCQCRAVSDLRLAFPHWQAPARPPEPRARVVSRLPLAPDVTQLVVELEDARPYAWLPGQHVQLLLEDGSRRNFSIANVPVAATPDSLLRSLQLRSPQLRAPLLRAPRCRATPRRTSPSAMRPGRSGWSSTSAACPAASSPTASCRAWRRAMR